MDKKRILLKLTGAILDRGSNGFSADAVNNVIEQIKQLQATHQFGIVIGGGNFFRGNQNSIQLGIEQSVGHQIGMLATMMNGLILKDLLEGQGIPVELFCAVECPKVGNSIAQKTITNALQNNKTIIFTGGTGNPFFTTDTSAILRSLQISADEIWKGTSVDGVYTKDPKKHTDAQRIPQLTFAQAIAQHLGVMDLTAYTMAQQYKQRIRIFDIFAPNALLQAAQNQNLGSIIQ